MTPATDEDHGPDGAADGEDRILTVPNAITVVRLACLPLFLWLLFVQEDRVWAASVLGALGATDWVDGYLARRWHQVSTLGKVLDPVADRLLFFVGGLAIIIDGADPPLGGLAGALPRGLVVSLATVGLALAGAKRIDVTWWGKAGTFCTMFAFPMFLASEGQLFWRDEARVLAWGFAIPGLVFGYIALALYVPSASGPCARAGRPGRASATGTRTGARAAAR